MNAFYLCFLSVASLITILLIHMPPLVRVENECILQQQQLNWENLTQKHTVDASDNDRKCDLFSGRWVLDNVSFPLYEEVECSFMKADYACQKYGRKDLKYQYWAWKPHGCQLPRFNGAELMEKIRGKRVVFVGDSLNRNQWTSMLCLIEASLRKSSQKSVIRNHNLFVFNATEYNATIEFYWSPYLVESNGDDPIHHSMLKETKVRIHSIDKHARVWSDADILIFDSFLWWARMKITLLWGNGPDAIHRVVKKNNRRIYELALNTWSGWLELNINPNKTKLFFMSLSPLHYNGEAMDGQQCYNETEPVLKEDYWGAQTEREMMQKAESVVDSLNKRGIYIQYLNITHLSDYRKDGHTSIYKKFLIPKPKEMDPRLYADCTHWCLPGVPDIWNIILYHYIINS